MKTKTAPAPVTWRRPAPPARLEFFDTFQQITIEVDEAPGWIVVAQERREVSGCQVWKISTLHTHHAWTGEDLPFGRMPCYRENTIDARDARINSVIHFLTAPLNFVYRDFTCPHCRITERDGNSGPNGALKVCVYCRKESVMTRCAQESK